MILGVAPRIELLKKELIISFAILELAGAFIGFKGTLAVTVSASLFFFLLYHIKILY